MRVILALPGLRHAAGQGFSPTQGLALPALSRLLGKGVRTAMPGKTAQQWLRAAFAAGQCGVAEVSRMIDMPGAESGTWLRADPVHVRIDRDRALLFDAGAFDLTQAEADALALALNQHFVEDGLRFHAPHPKRWYVKLNGELDITTTAIDMVAGDDIHPHLPRGSGGLRWHGWLNEIQMLLYTHPVNDAREALGELPINSIWPWGEGPLPSGLVRPAHTLFADDALATGLAHAAHMQTLPLPKRCPERLVDDTLIWADDLLPAARRGDLATWRDALVQLEQAWFVPLLAQWQAGNIDTLQLVCPDPAGTLVVTLDMTDRWKFWRRDGSLTILTIS